MKKILVPCDFSEPAINAYRQALNVAAQSDGVVHLLHVIEPPILNDTVLMPTLILEEEQMKDAKSNAEARFKSLIKTSKIDLVKTNFEVLIGSVADTIQKYITDEEIDLVIMGSTGASGLKEIFIGSIAEKVVRQSLVPVLVIKKYYDQPIKKIVFPNTLDTLDQEDLVMKVKELQDLLKATLCIVYINIPSRFEVEGTIRQHLSQFVKRYMFKDYTINIYSHTSIEKGIIEFTKMAGGDMIALGTHGHKGIVHLVKGSVAEDIVNHADRPIWTYRIKEDQLVETKN
jgi:nucleotide-binding universal stress UspA family protein